MNALSRALLSGGAIGLGVVAARALTQPLPEANTELLDWTSVVDTAHRRIRGGSIANLQTLNKNYGEIAATMASLLPSVCEEPLIAFPAVEAIDQRTFVSRNAVMMQRLLEPVEERRAQLPLTRLTQLGRTVTSKYVGELMAFLATRVLGQYDPVLQFADAASATFATSLYLVEPNVQAFARMQNLDIEDARQWLMLHEITHAWQFENHSWLRQYIVSLINEIVQYEVNLNNVSHWPNLLRSNATTLGKVQAVMSILEGHGNFVMRTVGENHIANFDQLDTAFHRRQQQRPLLEQIVFMVTGMNVKMRQYQAGETFCREVCEASDLHTLNALWQGPESIPTPGELHEPRLWLKRVAA